MALAELLQEELSQRLQFAGSMKTGDKAIAEAAIVNIYRLLGRPAPAVLWCQSLYQMATLPSLLIGLFFSDAWQIISGSLTGRHVDELWLEEFDQGWDALWAHGGQQLFRGMKGSSRIGEYWQLDSALILQCKRELADWLKSPKIQAFEQQLPKETIYRKFWGMQLWHLNFVNDRLRMLKSKLRNELESPSLQSQLTDVIPSEFYNDFFEAFSRASTSLHSIINRMGAEPASQLRHCVWLPLSLPEVAVCQSWIDHVENDAFNQFAEEILAWNRLAKCSFGVICLENVVFACEKPSKFSLDEGARLHNETGPALTFADGLNEYAWHGLVVEARLIEEPESITINEIDTTRNAELRRVLIERYGQTRYLIDSNALEIQQDDFGTLYKKEIPGDEPLVMVKVVNASPEPDGTFKDYFLRVPPHIETAKSGVAWTFGLSEEEYLPLTES